MELKQLVTQCAYRIEPKPEGGFIAHSTDPTAAPLEAPTREELQQKIRAKIATVLSEQIPGLKFPLESKQLNVTFHLERKPGGGFVIHSSDPDAKRIDDLTHEEVESKFAEKLLGFVGKHFVPELAQALAAQGLAGNSEEIKVFVNRKTTVGVNASFPELKSAAQQASLPEASIQPGDAKKMDLNLGSAGDATSNNLTEGLANVPITPEASGSGTFLRLLLALLIIGALAYFFLRFSH